MALGEVDRQLSFPKVSSAGTISVHDRFLRQPILRADQMGSSGRRFSFLLLYSFFGCIVGRLAEVNSDFLSGLAKWNSKVGVSPLLLTPGAGTTLVLAAPRHHRISMRATNSRHKLLSYLYVHRPSNFCMQHSQAWFEKMCKSKFNIFPMPLLEKTKQLLTKKRITYLSWIISTL